MDFFATQPTPQVVDAVDTVCFACLRKDVIFQTHEVGCLKKPMYDFPRNFTNITEEGEGTVPYFNLNGAVRTLTSDSVGRSPPTPGLARANAGWQDTDIHSSYGNGDGYAEGYTDAIYTQDAWGFFDTEGEYPNDFGELLDSIGSPMGNIKWTDHLSTLSAQATHLPFHDPHDPAFHHNGTGTANTQAASIVYNIPTPVQAHASSSHGAPQTPRTRNPKNFNRNGKPSQLFYCYSCGSLRARADLIKNHYDSVHAQIPGALKKCATDRCAGFLIVPYYGPPPPAKERKKVRLDDSVRKKVPPVCSAAARHQNHVCPICHLVFSSVRQLEEHKRTRHPGE